MSPWQLWATLSALKCAVILGLHDTWPKNAGMLYHAVCPLVHHAPWFMPLCCIPAMQCSMHACSIIMLIAVAPDSRLLK